MSGSQAGILIRVSDPTRAREGRLAIGFALVDQRPVIGPHQVIYALSPRLGAVPLYAAITIGRVRVELSVVAVLTDIDNAREVEFAECGEFTKEAAPPAAGGVFACARKVDDVVTTQGGCALGLDGQPGCLLASRFEFAPREHDQGQEQDGAS